MSVQARTMRDRRGRVYTPAVGPRLRPLLWIILIGFAVLGRQRLLPRQRHRADLVAGHHPADVLLHADGRPAPGPRLRPDRAVPGLRVRAPGDLVEAAEQGGGPVRPGAAGRRAGRSWSRAWSWCGSAASRSATRGSATVGYWLHVRRRRCVAIGLYVKHRLAGPRIRWDWARRFGVAVVGFVVVMGLLHSQDPRSFGVKGPKEGQAVFLPVRGRHGQRQVHPGRDADDGRLLPEVPQGRLRGLVSLGAPLQLVQQQGVPDRASARPARSRWSATATPRPPAGARAATTRCRSSRASSTTRITTT